MPEEEKEVKKISRLILKKGDVLVVTFDNRLPVRATRQLREQLRGMFPKNGILFLPSTVNLSVIGKEQITEYVSHVDLWSLFDDEGEE